MSTSNDPIHVPSREVSPEDANRRYMWRQMAAIHNASPTGFPLPENGGDGYVRSVSMHNSIAAYSAMLYREDASNENYPASPRVNKSKPSAKGRSKAKPSKAPTRATKRDSSAAPHPGTVTSSAPLAPSALAVPQRVTRSSARLSSKTASLAGPSPTVSAAPSAPAASAFVSTAKPKTSSAPVAAAASAVPQRVTRSSARLGSTSTSLAGRDSAVSADPATVVASSSTLRPQTSSAPVASAASAVSTALATVVAPLPIMTPQTPAPTVGAAVSRPGKIKIILRRLSASGMENTSQSESGSGTFPNVSRRIKLIPRKSTLIDQKKATGEKPIRRRSI